MVKSYWHQILYTKKEKLMSTPTSHQQYHVIFIDSKKSGAAPRGQKDAFPISYIEFPDPGSKVSLDDNSAFVPRYPLFSVYDLEDGNIDAGASLVKDLDDALYALRTKQEPTKITLMSVVHQDKEGKFDIKQYEPTTTIELDKATVHLVAGSTSTYQVQADKAILGTGDKASVKTEIDYTNSFVIGENSLVSSNFTQLAID